VGPGSALYGPDAANGVVSLHTKDPREYPGLSLEVMGGTRNFIDVQARYAAAGQQWGYKVFGEHQQGDEWTYDVSYRGNGPVPEVGTPMHYSIDRVGGSIARYFGEQARLQATVGMSVRDGLGIYSNGRIRYEDAAYRTAQLQFTSDHWFVQLYGVDSEPGTGVNLNTYTLNRAAFPNASLDSVWDMSRFTAASRMFAFEVQNNFTVSSLFRTGSAVIDQTHLTWGVQLRRDRITSEGRILTDRLTGRAIHIGQEGLYVQSESQLTNGARLVFAARYDQHSRYTSQISPKVGLLYDVGGGTIRATYNRAYRAPGVLWTELYWPNIQPGVGNMPGLGAFGNVDGYHIKNANGALIRSYAPLEPETNDTWELGFKSVLRSRVYIDIAAYHSRFRNFITNSVAIANPAGDSTAYNARTGEPVTDEHGRPQRVLSYFNVGEAVGTGLDIGLRFYFSNSVVTSTSISLSHLESVKSDRPDAPDAVSFNTSPARITHKLLLMRGGAAADLSLRYVKGYDFHGGVHYGRIPGFGTIDAGLSYQPPRKPFTLKLNAQNLFACVSGVSTLPATGIHTKSSATYVKRGECGVGLRHQEMINMPLLGTMVFLGVRWDMGAAR
jgi:outer membrane receptor for ferrienterochelin and colicins